ncbi:MAG: antitoxin VapB family protein [Thermoproteota archaeon]
MTHKTITVSKEAYDLLSSVKRGKESFTDVVKRVVREVRRKPLSSFAGRWTGDEEEVNRIFSGVRDLWVEYDRRLELTG